MEKGSGTEPCESLKLARTASASLSIEGVEIAKIAARSLIECLHREGNSDAASRNPILVISLSGRKLTDEGFDTFVDTLLETLQKEKDGEQSEGSVRLFRLRLGGNCLTAKSLPKLGMVIKLSAGDLRDLDLSQNCIKVGTFEQRDAWRDFLSSFDECSTLESVDFSGNPLGLRGLKILLGARFLRDQKAMDTVYL
ncbi:hypothetical protein PITC_086070 [Penicillium italicum]|uniref:Uncharacterized protein n=1 Tax=Penicillium italicum TaxID=40296 RepID=A0A0A2L271_PENIT|nr:hypothetical protein PITC_086070 [Penicillium italicum]